MQHSSALTISSKEKTRVVEFLVVLFGAIFWANACVAQAPTPAGESNRTVSPYLYLVNPAGSKVLLSTQFRRNDPKYDDRAFHRFLDVIAGLEKRGFHQDPKAAIDSWDKPEPVARGYVYLEDVQAGGRTKSGLITGSRVWCTDNGASEHEIRRSDSPKHVDALLHSFDQYLARSEKRTRG
ncbi:MAG: hypothetical protein ABI537_11100 [Casimicrobiaceae bacterium]